MSMFVELTAQTHAQTAVIKNAPLRFAVRLHMLNIQVTEISKLIGDLPVFFSRHQTSGQWLISALCSFTPGQNLFVQKEQWLASYQPVSMQTYPLSLSQAKPTKLAITMDKDVICPATEANAHALYTVDGQASVFLRQQVTMLETGLQHEYLSYQFIKTITELGLIKELDLHLLQQDGRSQIIKGLATVDEDKLQTLTAEQVYQLQQQGYLLILHAMLLSITQLNKLIQLHNQRYSGADSQDQQLGLLKSVRLELNRSQH
ncbi:SapC family protein [Rheinheimera tangshanensis]|uniref:SapC family protein n=1 Tax=Rheinheimera tangshanensis TaxID=400153 RepID=A0A5C8M070_9GAMM|nr:SapC family protein [Rheinheimera tangshanensis]TXK81278.1 SapC family protein [Rheinheimera tangshanensis]GGM59557.1 SapC [Rheinheimera tangshanensis]